MTLLKRLGWALAFVIIAALAAVLPAHFLGAGSPPPAAAMISEPATEGGGPPQPANGATAPQANGATAPQAVAQPAGSPEAIPRRIALPELGVQAPVIEVGLDEAGGVVVPDDVTTVGWYRGSVSLDSLAGSTVIVGHRNSAVAGSGAFDNLEGLEAGDRLRVVDESGTAHRFRVSEVEMVLKEDFASIVREAFGTDGAHRLTLITCGGDFDSAAGSYLSNVIVTATPA